MTERRAQRRPSPAWVFGAALGAFALVLALLAVQVRAGRDSALGPGTPVATPAGRPRRILVRRIVQTTVVTHVAAADPVPGAALGLSFYLRRRLGAKRWRATHRLTPLVYVLALAHTLGAGTDAGTPWLRGLLVVLSAPLVHLGVLRALPAPGRDSHRKRPTSDRGRAVAGAAGQPREASVSPPRRSPA